MRRVIPKGPVLYTECVHEWSKISYSDLLVGVQERKDFAFEHFSYANVALKNKFPYGWLKKLKVKIHAQLKRRFDEINYVRKNFIKKKYAGTVAHSYDRPLPSVLVPLPESRLVFKLLLKLIRVLPTEIKNIDGLPTLMIIGSAQNVQAYDIIKFAEKNGISLIAYLESWDHLTHHGPVIVSSAIKTYCVWSKLQEKELTKLHSVPAERITVVKPNILFTLDRVKNAASSGSIFEENYGITPEKKILFLAAYNERLGSFEPNLVRDLVASGFLNENNYALIIRPYPYDPSFSARFNHVFDDKHVFKYRGFDDRLLDRECFLMQLSKADVLISGAGSVVLEAFYFDTPVVLNVYEGDVDGGINTRNREYFFSDHFIDVVRRAPAPLIESLCDLKFELRNAVENPEMLRRNRYSVVREQFLSSSIDLLDVVKRFR